MTDTTQGAGLAGLAHEIWALAQRAPSEGIEDCTARIDTALRAALAAQAAPAIEGLTQRMLALQALMKRTDTMPIMKEWQALNSLRHRLQAASPAPAEAKEEPTDWQLNQLFDAVHEHGEFGRGFREQARHILACPAPAEAPATDIDEAAIARMAEQGAKAWAGVDPQSLRDGSYAPAPVEAKEEPKPVANLEKIQRDVLGDVRLTLFGKITEANLHQNSFDLIPGAAWEVIREAVKRAIKLTAREVADPMWPYAKEAAIAAQAGGAQNG